MQESGEQVRRRWADVVVMLTGLMLVGLAAWNAPASSGRPDETASLGSMYVAYAIGGGLAIAALFLVHRSRMIGRLLLVAAGLVVLGFGLDGFREGAGAVWLTVLLPALLLLGAAPFFGPMPRARSAG
jgi:hypothetical protein